MALPPIPVPMVTYAWGDDLNDYLVALSAAVAEPAGVIKAYAGAVAPATWAMCDGATVSRGGVYASLFNTIGTRYGAGDGASTFQLPNFKGKLLVGIDTTQNEFDPNVQGMYGGEKTHVLTYSEMTFHQHFMDHGHSWSGSVYIPVADMGYNSTSAQDFGPNLNEVVGTPVTNSYAVWSFTGSVGHTTQSTGPAGGGVGHNNLMPYALTNYIISLGN